MNVSTLTNDLATGLGLFFVAYMVWALIAELLQERSPAGKPRLALAPARVRSQRPTGRTNR